MGWRTIVRATLPVAIGTAGSVAAVTIIARAPTPGVEGQARVALQAVAMIAAMLPLLLLLRPWPRSIRTVVGDVIVQLTMAGGVFGLLSWFLVDRPTVPLAAAIFVPAACEELVFRAILPWYLLESLRRERVNAALALCVACIAAQLAFAVSHAVDARLTFLELVRLLAAGLLLAELVGLVGLWFAAAVHASFNYLLSMGPVTASPSAPALLLGVSLIGILLLVTRGRPIPRYALSACQLTRFSKGEDLARHRGPVAGLVHDATRARYP